VSKTDANKDFYFEDFVRGVPFTTPPFEMTETVITEFARIYDPQYYHLDRDAARASVFEGLVSAGFQTASLTWGLALRSGMFDKCAVAGLGVDELRWLAPVREGDVVRVEFWLLEGRPSTSRPGHGVARFQYQVKTQRDEVVLKLQMTQLLLMRPAALAAP
jgi:acyl dehydratase